MATETDIAFLLAEAADEVEIGIAPYAAVVRGGRRRRARRWAIATATALVIAGTTGTLALAGMPGGSGGRVEPAVTAPSQTGTPDLFGHRTVLASGTDQGKPWKVFVDVWAAPGDAAEAQGQLSAMIEQEEVPTGVSKASDLIGKTSFFVYRGSQKGKSWSVQNTFDAKDVQAGTDLESAALPLQPGSKGPQRLVVGHVAKTARSVTCTWKDGTTTVLGRDTSDGEGGAPGTFAIRAVEGSPNSWFVCLAPQGTSFKSTEVTR
ncbi:hypothetical protein ACWGKW_11465 [Streptomyces sp. NPDC054766]